MLWEVPACVLTLAGMGRENQHCSAGKSASLSPKNHHNVSSSTSRVEAIAGDLLPPWEGELTTPCKQSERPQALGMACFGVFTAER